MVTVYQNKNFLDYQRGTIPAEADMVKVAEVATTDLNTAYRLTNTIDNYWWENDRVSPCFEGEGCRSTSVGDVMKLGTDEYFVVASCGFEPLLNYQLP